ncbi:MAG: hypothetical protein L3J46_06790, partial [Kangiellaceae bacterium]|nr:hypothetical protein [Kangiellaceae bacterium]
DTSFLNLFGINIDYINDGSVSINYESVEVVSVNDIKSMPITSGSKYLFRGLRVKSFTINTKDNNSLGIEASIRKNPNVLSVSAIPFSTQKNVSLKGDGLFIAYQLVSFTKKSSNQNNYTLSALVKDRSDYKINNDYLLRIEQANVRKCVLQAKTKRGFSDYSKPTLKERYKGWPWVVNGDIESFAWLTFEECSNNKYEISAIKTNATVAGERVKAEFNVPFDWGSQDKEEYLIDVHIAGNSLLIDRIRFSNLANRDVEKIFKTGSRTGYIELQGIITFYRDTYDVLVKSHRTLSLESFHS